MAALALLNANFEAETLAAKMPRLILEARRLASHLSMGLHGRRKAGVGENFWQYRNLNEGEDARRIDWRRSARENILYVREKEWEISQKLTLYPDLSASMQFGTPEKRERAIVFTLALGSLLVEGGERISLAGLTPAFSHRNMIEKMAEEIVRLEENLNKPTFPLTQKQGEPLYFTDGFMPLNHLESELKGWKQRGFLVVITSEEEETFPYEGRVIFEEFEENLKLEAGKAQKFKAGYLEKLRLHKAGIRELTAKLGWRVHFHVTDSNHSPFLLKLLLELQQRRD